MKALPSHQEAEQRIIGAILNNVKAIDEIITELNPKDFYYEKHRIIYSCILEMYSKDLAIDTVTLGEELSKLKKLQDVGGISYIVELMGNFCFVSNIKAYIEIVKDKANRRRLIQVGQEIMSNAYADESNVKEIIDKAENSIFQVVEKRTDSIKSINDCVENAINKIDAVYQHGGGITGIPTGFTLLDKHLNGLQKGDSVIIAARPSMGKTAFALNIASNVSKTKKVAIFSLEMGEDQLTERMIAATTLTELNNLRTGKLTDEEWRRIGEGASELASKNIKIDATATLNVNEIKARCKKMKIKDGLDVVIIDYLGLIEPGNKKESREQEISTISRTLKKIAKELDITLITLAQLSRAPEQRADHRPILSDLRESGTIEQDADIVMFLYREEYYDCETLEKNIAECIIAKNRNGQVGTTKLAWLGQYQKFANLDTYHKK